MAEVGPRLLLEHSEDCPLIIETVRNAIFFIRAWVASHGSRFFPPDLRHELVTYVCYPPKEPVVLIEAGKVLDKFGQM